MKGDNNFRNISVAIIATWLGIFALFAFLLVLFASFMVPNSNKLFSFQFTLSNYETLLSSLYFLVFI
ncbi:MAG: spermidine/putrescine ABC transporter permease PotB, partial [Gammaproteobacteria bacterium]